MKKQNGKRCQTFVWCCMCNPTPAKSLFSSATIGSIKQREACACVCVCVYVHSAFSSDVILVQTVPSVCLTKWQSIVLCGARLSSHEPVHLELMITLLNTRCYDNRLSFAAVCQQTSRYEYVMQTCTPTQQKLHSSYITDIPLCFNTFNWPLCYSKQTQSVVHLQKVFASVVHTRVEGVEWGVGLVSAPVHQNLYAGIN